MKGLASLGLVATEHLSNARATGQERSWGPRNAKGYLIRGESMLSIIVNYN